MIAQRLIQVMEEITRMSKDGKNSAQGFDFLSEQKITTELHGAFARAGLTFRPLSMEILSEFDYPTKSSTAHAIRIRCTYSLSDIDGESMIIQSLGEGSDSGDKATNKAMSAAYKYALRQLCMISTGEDPDKSSNIATGSAQRLNDALAGPKCADCTKTIVGGKLGAKVYTTAEVVEKTTATYGRQLCATCAAKAKVTAATETAAPEAGGDV